MFHGDLCEESYGLYPVYPSRPGDFNPDLGPCRHEFRAAQAARELDGKVHEAPEEGTKEGA